MGHDSDIPLYACNGYIGLYFTIVCGERVEHCCSVIRIIKRPARDACLCMGELPAPPAPPAPHFVFLITL